MAKPKVNVKTVSKYLLRNLMLLRNTVPYMFGPITIAIFDASERKIPFG